MVHCAQISGMSTLSKVAAGILSEIMTAYAKHQNTATAKKDYGHKQCSLTGTDGYLLDKRQTVCRELRKAGIYG